LGPVTIQRQDAFGNPVTTGSTTVNVSSSSAGGKFAATSGGSVISSATITAGNSSVSVFYGDTVAGSPTLSAAASGLTSGTQGATISPAAASKLAFTTQPAGATGGSAFGTQPVVTVQDAFGNPVPSDASSVTLAIGTNPSSGALTCTTNPVAASAGVASFAGCKIDKAGNGYTLVATDGALTSATSNAFNVTVGAAAKLAFTQQPSSSTGGVAFPTQPKVTVQDAGGNTVASSASIALAIGTNPSGGALSGTTTVTATNGVATFSGLAIDKAGSGYTLTASSGALTGDTSTPFNVTVGPAAKLAFTAQPAGATGGSAFGTQPVVTVQDAGGNTVTSDASSVTLAIGTNPSGGALTCTANPKAAASGVVSFAGCKIDKAGNGYTLVATDGALASATSSAFNVTVGAATQFVVSAPATANAGGAVAGITLTAADAGGNVVTTYTGSHAITWSGASNAPNGTAPSYPASSVSFTNGVSTTSLSGTFYKAETFNLTASATAPAVTGSTSITISAISPSAMRLSNCAVNGSATACTSPYSLGNGGSMTAAVQVVDTYGNPATPTTVTITLTSGNTGTFTVTSPVQITNGNTSTQFTVQKVGNGNTSTTITAHATSGSYADLTFTVQK
jgi:hypothetical protein